MAWTDADTVEAVAAAAQIAAAAGTVYLALKTRKLAKETTELALTTSQVATSSGREADAALALVTEAQEDRRLAYRPYLVHFEVARTSNSSNAGITETFRLTNVARGPAFRCVYVVCDNDADRWGYCRLEALGSDSTSDQLVTRPMYKHTPNVFGLEPYEEGRASSPYSAVFCEDTFGNRYRFMGGFRQTWQKGTEPVPDWAVDRFLWTPDPKDF